MVSPRSVSGREGAPEEPSDAMVRLIRGSSLWSLPDLFPGERVPSEAISWFSPLIVAHRTLAVLSLRHRSMPLVPSAPWGLKSAHSRS